MNNKPDHSYLILNQVKYFRPNNFATSKNKLLIKLSWKTG